MKLFNKKFLMAWILILVMASVYGCGSSGGEASSAGQDSSKNDSAEATEEQTSEEDSSSEGTEVDKESTEEDNAGGMDMTGVVTAKNIEGFDQTAMPDEGDTIGTISIEGYGDVVVRFFEDIAPYGVKNFVEHAKEGYYDGLTFHRVINDFMIQGGDPDGTGTGGESIWGTPFYNEISEQACVIRGSLCYANSGVDPSNGSQFFITQAPTVEEESIESLETQGMSFTKEQKDSYIKNGGCPWLQGGYTVFGQVIEGMDIVDEVAAVSVNESDKPDEDVIISSVKISEYKPAK